MAMRRDSAEELLPVWRPANGAKLRKAQALKGDEKKVGGIQEQISPPKTPWLRAEAEQPFKAGVLHPEGCLRNDASNKWERSTYRKQRHVQ